MRYALAMGRVAGIPLYWHWSFLPVVAWLAYRVYALQNAIDWSQAAWAGMIILLLFCFVLVHELGHALVARYYGQTTERIIFFPLGGGAYIPKMPASIRQEIAVYLAGPLSNLALALLLLPLLLFSVDGALFLRYYLNPFSNMLLPDNWWAQLLSICIAVNLLLGLLNLIPAYPLDGGRVIQALLRKPMGQRRATILVSSLGLLAGGCLLLFSYRRGDWILGAGGLFIAGLSWQAIRQGWQKRRLQKYRVEALQRQLPVQLLYLSDSLSTAADQFQQTNFPVLAVYDSWQNFQGFLAKDSLEEVKPPLAQAKVNDHFDPFWSTTSPQQNLFVATEAIISANAYGAIVYEKERPTGLLAMEDVMELLSSRY
ncbi:MAG: site-2 protease family protein [Bacteroidota bacterium]